MIGIPQLDCDGENNTRNTMKSATVHGVGLPQRRKDRRDDTKGTNMINRCVLGVTKGIPENHP
jgi:hypothetical protein